MLQHICCVENYSDPKCPALALAPGESQSNQGKHPCGCRSAQQKGIRPDQLASVKRENVNESDVDDAKQPDREQARTQSGEAGGDEEVHRVALDVTAEIRKTVLFCGFVLLIRAACADVEGLHRTVIMHQDGALFNEKQNL